MSIEFEDANPGICTKPVHLGPFALLGYSFETFVGGQILSEYAILGRGITQMEGEPGPRVTFDFFPFGRTLMITEGPVR